MVISKLTSGAVGNTWSHSRLAIQLLALGNRQLPLLQYVFPHERPFSSSSKHKICEHKLQSASSRLWSFPRDVVKIFKLCYYVSGIHHVIIFTRPFSVIHTASDDSCGEGLGTRLDWTVSVTQVVYIHCSIPYSSPVSFSCGRAWEWG